MNSGIVEIRCVVCGRVIYGGIYIGGLGPYCVECVPRIGYNSNYILQGWECPKCKRILSPTQTFCTFCVPPVVCQLQTSTRTIGYIN